MRKPVCTVPSAIAMLVGAASVLWPSAVYAQVAQSPGATPAAQAAAPAQQEDTPNPELQAEQANAESVQQQASGDIIVTAQRRAERLQDVPIAISALNEETLEQRNIESVEHLQGTVPGLTVTGFAGVNATNLVSIRGVAGQPVPIGASQATAVYLDGVFLAKPDAAFFALEDVERVEVLRGPQGTLYGRNATAGAINIITHTPGRDLRGAFDVSYGNRNALTAGGYVSAPLGEGLAGSFSGSYTRRDGFLRNTVTGNRLGDSDSITGRVKLRFERNNFDALISGDYTKRSSQDLFTLSRLVNGEVEFAENTVTTNIEDQIDSDLETGGVSLTMNLEATDDFTVTSISSYRTFDFFTIYDIDATAALAIQPIFLNSIDTFSQEVRGVYTGDTVRLTVGANYYKEDGEVFLRVNPVAYTEAALRADPRPHAQNHLTALAGFGQLEVDLFEGLTAIAGARLNYETRDFSIDYSTAGPFAPIIGEVSDTALLPSFGVNYEPTQDILLYAKASKGYQSPGFAYQPGAGGALNTFGAESLWAYEIGAKTQFWDRRITFNTAAFYYDYKDIQLRRLITQLISRIENVGAATVKGFEAELTVVPVTGLTLTGQLTYSKAVYTDFCEGITAGTPQFEDPVCVGTPAPTADRSGNALNQAPRWSGGIGANYSGPVGAGMQLNLNGNYIWESNSYFTAVNEPQVSTGGWHRLDARAGLEFDNGLEVYAFGRNLTDERHIVMAFRFGGNVSAVVNEPRTYGVGVRYRF